MAQTYNKVSDMADPTCDNGSEGAKVMKSEDALEGRKPSWGKLRRIDSLNLEAEKVSNIRTHGPQVGWSRTLHLAFQSIGVVYGDIGTSPLYVYASTFTDGIKETEDLLGVLSLILYTMILIPLLKYVFIVLWANDDGDGESISLAIVWVNCTIYLEIVSQYSIKKQKNNFEKCVPRILLVIKSYTHFEGTARRQKSSEEGKNFTNN